MAIHSPLNYTGGKYRLLPQLLPLFPKRPRVFVDLFGGGFNVGANAEAESVVYNDVNHHLVGVFQAFLDTPIEALIETLRQSYSNVSYQLKDRTSETREVLVTNY